MRCTVTLSLPEFAPAVGAPAAAPPFESSPPFLEPSESLPFTFEDVVGELAEEVLDGVDTL